jgi:HD-GYP domain-containing protein (c-di-GMP phosphodiesterase class II)
MNTNGRNIFTSIETTGGETGQGFRLAEEFVGRLCVLTQSALSRKSDHDLLIQTSRSARAILESLLEQEPTARFDVIANCVLYDRVRLKTDIITPEVLHYFLDQMMGRDIRAIIFDNTADADDILDFCRALAKVDASDKEPFKEVKRLIKFDGISGIRILERKAGIDEFYRNNELLLSSAERARGAYFSALYLIREAMRYGFGNRCATLRSAKRVVQSLLNCIESDRDAVFTLTSIRDCDEFSYIHSANVCVFSMALASKLDIPGTAIREIGVAGLLHDLGRANIPIPVLIQTEGLTEGEWRKIRDHTRFGTEALARLRQADRSILSAIVAAFTHHMNIDRSGYPMTGRPIGPNISSRIVRIADVYDSLTNARSYEVRPFSKSQALAMIREKSTTELDPLLSMIFADLMAEVPDDLSLKDVLGVTDS